MGTDRDTRKVQTAVLGGRDGTEPVFLPYEKSAAVQIRDRHGKESFTCGLLLGGCGKPLSVKAYGDRKSHFAHHPPVTCRRADTGEDSADHLYIAKALESWLANQGWCRVRVSYLVQGEVSAGPQKPAPKDAIEIRFGDAESNYLIHAQLSPRALVDWQGDARRFATENVGDTVIRLYGTRSRRAPDEMRAGGYALVVRCMEENGTREVSIGTLLPDHPTEWTNLERCRLTGSGVVTPSLPAGPARRDETNHVAITHQVSSPPPEDLQAAPVGRIRRDRSSDDARADFLKLVEDFNHARDSGDGDAAERLSVSIGVVFGSALSFEDQGRFRPLKYGLDSWVRENKEKQRLARRARELYLQAERVELRRRRDDGRERIRWIIEDLSSRRRTLTLVEFHAAATEIDRLTRDLSLQVSESEEALLERLYQGVRDRERSRTVQAMKELLQRVNPPSRSEIRGVVARADRLRREFSVKLPALEAEMLETLRARLQVLGTENQRRPTSVNAATTAGRPSARSPRKVTASPEQLYAPAMEIMKTLDALEQLVGHSGGPEVQGAVEELGRRFEKFGGRIPKSYRKRLLYLRRSLQDKKIGE